MSRNKKKINVSIKVDSATNAEITGVKIGADSEEIRKILREEIQQLVYRERNDYVKLESADPIIGSLFVCDSGFKSTLGFAINNSGLILCSSIIHPIEYARRIDTSEKISVLPVQRSNMLQVVDLSLPTQGLIPSYRSPIRDEKLWIIDEQGDQCKMTVFDESVWMKLPTRDGTLIVDEGFLTKFSGSHKLFGGPVMNTSNEVMGIAVGATTMGYLIVQPWSSIENCIIMETSTMEDVDSKKGIFEKIKDSLQRS